MTENKRFTEIISTQKVIDNQTGKEYNCLIDDDLLKLLNEIDKKYVDEYVLRETLQLELQRVEEENKILKTRFKKERELAMRLSKECDTLTIKKQELELEIIRLETIIRTGEKVIE